MIISKTINKVINNTDSESEALLDLTADTVAPENLLLNKTAHNRDGEGIVGEMPEGGASDYDELENRPRINSNLLTGNKTGSQLGLQNRVLASALNIGGQTVTEVEEALGSLADISKSMTGATSSAAGEGGFVPSPSAGDENKALFGDGTWKPVSGGGGGGHAILDEDGTTYPQRSKLQFEGCEVTDDAVNGITVVKCEGGAKKYAKPVITVGTYTYDGTTQAPTITGFDANVMTLTGTYEAINAGSYTFTIALSDKTSSKWTDDTQDDIVTNWSIDAISVAVPTVTGTTKTYNGSAQSPTITRDTANTSISGTTSATKVKSNYSFSIALTDTTNHKWSDNTTAAKSYTWKINPPTGSSYTPVNNIQAWLQCASIDKTYTTIAQVLADATTLSALMLSNNAVDYLVRSKSWATAKGLVPTMTSNTTPSGVASASSVYNNDSSFAAYKAFDNSDTGWIGNDVNNLWIRYQFETPVLCKNVKWKNRTWTEASAIKSPKNYKIQGSNDGSTWVDLGTFINNDNSSGATHECDISSNNNSYLYLQMAIIDCNSGNYNYCCVSSLQFYAYPNPVSEGICDNATAMTDIGTDEYCFTTLWRDATWRDAISYSTYFENVLTVKIPTMTSNTTPSGVVSAYSIYGTKYAAWTACNYVDSTPGWDPSSASDTGWIQYQFATPMKALMVMFYDITGTSGRTETHQRKFQGSNNGTNWTDIADVSGTSPKSNITRHSFVNDNDYTYFRLYGRFDGNVTDGYKFKIYGRSASS